jgi:hypothetical protein
MISAMSFPGLDDHLVEAEVTRDKIIGGERVVLSPAHEPYATQHTEINYVVRAHVAPGYGAATHLLTRHDKESDFATDTCVRRKGADPETGGRYLEEIAFEVVSELKERYVREKALRMHRRGVRRIFAVWASDQRICEWSPESQSWRLLAADSWIEDPCFVLPISVAALFDPTAADNAVAAALIAKSNPGSPQWIRQREAEGEARGEARGQAAAVLKVLESRGVAVSEAQRQQILRCQDLDRLDRWLRRAIEASSADEALSDS